MFRPFMPNALLCDMPTGGMEGEACTCVVMIFSRGKTIVSAEKEITDLMNLYCTAIDSGDLKTFARLFANAQWIAEGKVPGPESMNNMILYEDGTPRTKHVITNLTLKIDEAAGVSSSHGYVTVYQQTPDFPLQVIFAGDYYDEFSRGVDGWAFAKREIRNSLIGNMQAHLKVPSLTIPGAKP